MQGARGTMLIQTDDGTWINSDFKICGVGDYSTTAKEYFDRSRVKRKPFERKFNIRKIQRLYKDYKQQQVINENSWIYKWGRYGDKHERYSIYDADGNLLEKGLTTYDLGTRLVVEGLYDEDN